MTYRGVTPLDPPMWQAEADTELTLFASSTTAVGQKALALAKRRYSTVRPSLRVRDNLDFRLIEVYLLKIIMSLINNV